MMNWMILAMAGPAGAGPGGQPQQSPVFMIGWLVLMMAVFYFILIRPQQRREKERRALIAAVKTGDHIVFSGGLMGVVANVKDKTLVVKIADNVKIEVARYAVSQVLEKGAEPQPETGK